MKAHHCLLHDDGSWTDPVTNALAFPNFGRNELVSALVGGVLPPDSMASFLHEMTHHWCFRTPVGTAIAEIHNFYESLIRTDHGGALPEEALASRFRFLLALETLRPITEGLALFAEFDIMPSPRNALASDPLRWASAFYVPKDRSAAVDIAEALLSVRLERDTVRRKLDLLMQDLLWSSAGYLPGYLLIHDIYRGLAQRSNCELLEPDEFLSFAVQHFYGSEELQSLLAERDTHADDWSRAWVRAWGRLMREATQLLDNRRALQSARPSPSNARTGITTLRERDVASVAEITVEVQPCESHEVSVRLDGEELFRCRSRLELSRTDATASLELWFAVGHGRPGVVVFHDDEVILSREASGEEWTALEPVFSRCRSRRKRIELRNRAATWLTTKFRADMRTADYARTLMGSLEHIMAIHADALFENLPESVGERLGETMVDGGFLSFFDGDVERAEDYVRLSLVSRALRHDRGAMNRLSSLLPALNRAVKDATRLKERTGVPFIAVEGDQLECLL